MLSVHSPTAVFDHIIRHVAHASPPAPVSGSKKAALMALGVVAPSQITVQPPLDLISDAITPTRAADRLQPALMPMPLIFTRSPTARDTGALHSLLPQPHHRGPTIDPIIHPCNAPPEARRFRHRSGAARVGSVSDSAKSAASHPSPFETEDAAFRSS